VKRVVQAAGVYLNHGRAEFGRGFDLGRLARRMNSDTRMTDCF